MRLSWWQRRTPAQVSLATMAVCTAYGIALPLMLRSDHYLLTVPVMALLGSAITAVSNAGGVGDRRQVKLVRQAYREIRIPPGADEERWRAYFVTRIAQHDLFWSRVVTLYNAALVAVVLIVGFALPLTWAVAVAGACAVVGAGLAQRLPDEPRWLDDSRFLLTQLGRDGHRDP